ncbi:hypothetical protein PV04_07968 [Phialophora macrospora]|uniref:Uncharacterized protein n=1 Tax=Phialophora macrospora TaxID=1851006 RepID=A0A0D2DUH3_9EURO|nr:hypothetical protein PV04_07968 [Phialophora macrospora]
MDRQLSSILRYWYILPTESKSANCEDILTSTILLHVTLWTIATVIFLGLGSVHGRHVIRTWLHLKHVEYDRKRLSYSVKVRLLGASALQIAFNLATGKVLSSNGSNISLADALALWILRPSPFCLARALTLIVGGEYYTDALRDIEASAIPSAILSIWPYAFLCSATWKIDSSTHDILQLFSVEKSALPLLRAGSALGVVLWVALRLVWWYQGRRGELQYFWWFRCLVSPLLSLLGLLASCLVWLGALQIVGNQHFCAFYLDSRMRRGILMLWTAEPVAQLLWGSLFPSDIPWLFEMGRIAARDWY